MNHLSTPEATTAATRRFSLWSLFQLQLVVSPLFLAPLYLPSHQTTHPYAYAIGLLVAPIVYVAMMEVLFSKSEYAKWRVLAAIRRGGAWGMMFGLLSMAPAQIGQSFTHSVRFRNELAALGNALYYQSPRALFSANPGLINLVMLILGLPVLILFILLHYALIGAAVAGVIALIRNAKQANSSMQHTTQY